MSWRKWLLPLSGPYYLATWLRNKGFDLGILKSSQFDVPILVIGNLSTGGTGKTPHTEWVLGSGLARNPVVLSRGYGRKTKGFHWVESDALAEAVGDEPLQIKRKFPDISVAVCEDRVLAVPEIMNRHPETDLIILDDAYQHRYLRPQYSLLLTRYDALYADDLLLPAGNLREPRQGVSRANVVVVTKCPGELQADEKERIAQKLKLSSDQHLFFSYQEYGEERYLSGQVAELRSKDVFIFSAIAGGDRWAKGLLDRFKSKKGSLTYRDHHRFSKYDIELLLKKTTEDDIILTTEKDAMRLEPFKEQLQNRTVAFYPLRISLGKDGVRMQTVLKSGLGL